MKTLVEKGAQGEYPRSCGNRHGRQRKVGRCEGFEAEGRPQAGVESLKRCLPALLRLGVKFCTFYVFSTENWKRPKDEVQFLMSLILSSQGRP